MALCLLNQGFDFLKNVMLVVSDFFTEYRIQLFRCEITGHQCYLDCRTDPGFRVSRVNIKILPELNFRKPAICPFVVFEESGHGLIRHSTAELTGQNRPARLKNLLSDQPNSL